MEAEVPGSDPPMALKASTSNSGGNPASRETPIVNVPPQIGFTETYTTIIPTVFYLSVNKLDTRTVDQLNKVELRMNAPYGILAHPTSFVTQSAATSVERGVSLVQAPNGESHGTSLIQFPTSYTSSHKPMWLSYWEKIYEVYTVLETQYEITIVPARDDARVRGMVMWEFDTYGATSTGNVMPAARLDDMARFRGVKKKLIGTLNGNDPRQPDPTPIISGTWRPGQLHHNVKNDGDAKTWSVTGAAPNPEYWETLHMRFFKSPMHSNTTDCHYNLRIELKYVVQFKDLKATARYPIAGATGITLALPNDILKTD